MLDKIGYNSAYIRDIREIFVYDRGFSGVGLFNDAWQILLRPTPVVMATKFGTKSAIGRLVQNIPRSSLRPTVGFRGRQGARKILPRPTPVAMTTKFETKSTITRLIYEISARSLRITGGFWDRAIEWCPANSTATNFCCHGNDIWDKIVYNSAYIRDIVKNFAHNRGFSGSGYWTMLDKFYCDQSLLPWQRKIWDKIGYKSACIRGI